MKKLFIDFDNTIVDTTRATCITYNIIHSTNIQPEVIENYDMSPHLILNGNFNIFSNFILYNHLKLFDGVIECLNKLKDNFEIYLVTNCSLESIPLKSQWIKENLPKNIFSGMIFLNTGQGYDKSLIDMKDSILIDDHRENHLTSNAKYHFNFKKYEKQNWGPLPGESIEFTKWDENIVNTIKIYK